MLAPEKKRVDWVKPRCKKKPVLSIFFPSFIRCIFGVKGGGKIEEPPAEEEGRALLWFIFG